MTKRLEGKALTPTYRRKIEGWWSERSRGEKIAMGVGAGALVACTGAAIIAGGIVVEAGGVLVAVGTAAKAYAKTRATADASS
jgi:hypothetical protein